MFATACCLKCCKSLFWAAAAIFGGILLSLHILTLLGGTPPSAAMAQKLLRNMLVEEDWWKGRSGHVRPGFALRCENFCVARDSSVKSSCTGTPCRGCLHCQPKVHLITYGNDRFANSKQRIVKEARQTDWFETVAALGPEFLPQGFRANYAGILNQTRGGGYWIWKLEIIRQSLKLIDEGEFLVYLDAGCTINEIGQQRFVEYVQLVDSSRFDILSFQTRYPEHVFTTERIFQFYNVTKDSAVRDSGMYIATILVMQKGPHLRKWLALALRALVDDPGLLTDRDELTSKDADSRFRTPRHDQSVMSVTRKLVGSVVMPDETWANAPNSPNLDAWRRVEGGFYAHIPFWSTRIKV